jgi:hypothetical protein
LGRQEEPKSERSSFVFAVDKFEAAVVYLQIETFNHVSKRMLEKRNCRISPVKFIPASAGRRLLIVHAVAHLSGNGRVAAVMVEADETSTVDATDGPASSSTNRHIKRVKDELPQMGHRNWIVIVDSAYPCRAVQEWRRLRRGRINFR